MATNPLFTPRPVIRPVASPGSTDPGGMATIGQGMDERTGLPIGQPAVGMAAPQNILGGSGLMTTRPPVPVGGGSNLPPGMSFIGGNPNFDMRTGKMIRPTPGNPPFGQPMPPITPGQEGLVRPGVTPLPQRPPVGAPAPLPMPPQRPPVMATPQTGLLGGEAALRQSQQQGLSAIQSSLGAGMGTLLGGFGQARQALQQGAGLLGGGFGGGAASASAAAAQAAELDPLTGQPLFREAASGVGAFRGAGLDAQERLAALTGARGEEAFRQAMIDDPIQRFLNERAQQALINQRAATGGVGSGAVLTELQQLGQAQAAQDVQRQIQNLTGLSQQGLQAAGQQGQFLSQAGQQQGQLTQAQAQMQQQAALQNAQLATQASMQNAQLATEASLAGARNRLAAAQTQAGLMGQQAGLAASLAGQGAGLQAQAGRDLLGLARGVGQDIFGARIQAGRDLSSAIGATTGQMSQLQAQQGLQLSNLLGSGALNVSNLLAGAGQAASAGNTQLAQLLANLAVGQGTNQANIALQGGQTGAQLALAQGQNQSELMQQLAEIIADRN